MTKKERRAVIKYQNQTGVKCKHQALAAVRKKANED